jgi:hypothetical protein
VSNKNQKESSTTVRRYHAFLLRLWQEGPAHPWRVSLQDASTQEQQAFATIEQLMAFLRELVKPAAVPRKRTDDDEGGGGEHLSISQSDYKDG